MNILVTGCAGFIGSSVSALLVRHGHRVIGIDNLNTAYDVRLKQWRLARLRELPGITLWDRDITDRGALADLLRGHSVDAVVNLAARAGVRQSLRDPWAYYETNTIGALNLLELCRALRISKFVLASSSSVYSAGARPFREDQPTDRPLSPYAASKKAAETLCYTYHSLFKLDVSVLRYFTVYGPAGRPDMAPFRFVRWITEGEPVIVYGDGSQERDFTFVEDVAEGTFRALAPVGYEIINLGGDRPVPIRDLIAILERQIGRPARIDRRATNPADIQATWADIAKARRILEWTPRTRLEDGLQRCVDWYQENRSWASQVTVGE